MYRTVATRPRSRTSLAGQTLSGEWVWPARPLTYLTLALALWFFMDQASNLVLPWESSFRVGGRRRGFIQIVNADYRYFDL